MYFYSDVTHKSRDRRNLDAYEMACATKLLELHRKDNATVIDG